MRLFRHTIPPLRLTAGPGALAGLPAELDRLGVSRVALVCGGSLLRSAELHGAVAGALGPRLAGTFSGVRPHSPLPAVEAAAAALEEMRAEAVLAVGGGSVIVTARAAAILLAEKRPVRDLCTRLEAGGRMVSPRLEAPKLPQIVMPVTPTTAAAKAGAAVQDPATGERLALFDPAARARCLLLAPELMAPVPAPVVASAALNALAMAVEGLLSPLPPNPLADAALIHAIRLLAAHLRPAVLSGDAESRMQLAMAAVLAGQGTDYAGGGVVSALGHAIGPRHHADNGIVNAILLPAALRFNAAHAAEGIAKVAAGFGLPASADPEPVAGAVRALAADLSLPRVLGDLGMTEADLPPVAAAAMRDWFLRGNPRAVTDAAELERLMAGVLRVVSL